MLAVAVRGRAAEHADDHVGSVRAHHVHDVSQQRVARPLRERFVSGLGEAVIERACEELLRAVEASRREQFTGADQAEPFLQLRTDQVLATLPARQ
ncbi:hypothetical protein BH23GEM10_BH23GEM10_06100 [soil metagenome]